MSIGLWVLISGAVAAIGAIVWHKRISTVGDAEDYIIPELVSLLLLSLGVGAIVAGVVLLLMGD